MKRLLLVVAVGLALLVPTSAFAATCTPPGPEGNSRWYSERDRTISGTVPASPADNYVQSEWVAPSSVGANNFTAGWLSIDYFGTGSTHYWIQLGIDQPGANLVSSDCGSFTPPCVYFERTATNGAYTYTPIKSIASATLTKLEMKTGSNCSGGSGLGNHYWCAFVDGVSVGAINFGTVYPNDEGEGLESYHASSGPCNDVYYEFDNGVPGWSSLPSVSIDSPYEMFTWGTGSGLGSGFATDLNTGVLNPFRTGATAFTVPATLVTPSANISAPRHQFITSHPNLP